jgi:hypothetical protein
MDSMNYLLRIILYENGKILVQYTVVRGRPIRRRNGAVGIESPNLVDRPFWLQYLYNVSGVNLLRDSLAILFYRELPRTILRPPLSWRLCR